jgi:hypothetical protein
MLQDRKGEHKDAVIQWLYEWRKETWWKLYSKAPYTSVGLLSENMIARMATSRSFRTPSDYGEIRWAWHKKHGEEVFAGIAAIDAKYDNLEQQRLDAIKSEEDQVKSDHQINGA